MKTALHSNLVCLTFIIYSFCTNAIASSTDIAPLYLNEGQSEYDLAGNIEFLDDPQGDLGIHQLLMAGSKLQWRTHQGTSPSFGYTRNAIWIKRTLSTDQLQPTLARYVLQIHYSLLDEIDVFYVSNGSVEEHFSTGESKPFGERAIKHRNFIFPLTLTNSKNITIYIRFRTTGSMRLPISLWTETAFFDHEQRAMGWQGIFAGALMVMLLYNLTLAIFAKDKTYFFYVAFIASELLIFCQFHGLNYQYLWPESPSWNTIALPFMIGILMTSGVGFVTLFLDLKRQLPKHYPALIVLAFVGIGISLLSFIVPYTIMVRVGSIIIGCLMLYAIGITIYLLKRGYRAARFVVVAWCILVFSGFLFLLNANGYASPSFLIENAVQFGSILEVALLSLAFSDRINIERQAKQMAQGALVEVQKQANTQLEFMVKERTEELQLANSKLVEINTLDPLTGVKNRGYFNENIEKELKRASRSNTPLTLIMLDIDHFKAINDQHGHPTGDKAIIHIAKILRTIIRRPSDAIARYGGEEFAILLPHTDAAGAFTVAERIRTTIAHKPLQLETIRVDITASLGFHVSLTPANETPQSLIEFADTALYAAKHQGRNRVIGSTSGGANHEIDIDDSNIDNTDNSML